MMTQCPLASTTTAATFQSGHANSKSLVCSLTTARDPFATSGRLTSAILDVEPPGPSELPEQPGDGTSSRR